MTGVQTCALPICLHQALERALEAASNHDPSVTTTLLHLGDHRISFADGRPADAYEIGIQESRAFYLDTPYSSELSNFERVLSGQVGRLPESAVASSGYVVHTLEASIWCLLNTGSFRESTLRAVNLGEDTDTTATVTGGLAGIYYGVSSIPDEWLHQLARREDLGRLFENFHQRLESSTPDEAEGEC